MAPPVMTGTENFSNTGGFPNNSTELVTRVHTGGKLLIIWCGVGQNASGGTQIPVVNRFALTGMSNPVLPTTLLVDQQITSDNWGIKVWRSTDNLPPGTYSASVAISGIGAGTINGSLFLFSVNNWAGSVASIIRANASSTTTPDRSHTVTTTVNDLPVAIWTYTDNAAGGTGPSVSGNTVQQAFNTHTGSGLFARIAALVAKEPGLAGTTTLDCTDSGYGTILSAISVAFALTGNTNTQTPLFMGGNLNFSGAAAAESALKTRVVAGNLSFSGALARIPFLSRALMGNLSFSGALSRMTAFRRDVAGVLSFHGAFARLASLHRPLIGILRFDGDVVVDKVTAAFLVTVNGFLAFSGALVKRISVTQFVTGILSFLGELLARPPVKLDMTGSLGFSGTMQSRAIVGRMLEGLLRFSGSAIARVINASRKFIVAAQRRTGYKRFGDTP